MQPDPWPRFGDGAEHATDDTLAPVVSLAAARRRRAYRQPSHLGAPTEGPNALSQWVIGLLDHTTGHGCSVRTTMASIGSWRELIVHAHNDAPTGHVFVTPSQPNHVRAIENAWVLLADLGAQPTLDVEIDVAPGYLGVALRGVLADPVMTPDIADGLTAALHADTGQHWSLEVSPSGALHWQTRAPYRAVVP